MKNETLWSPKSETLADIAKSFLLEVEQLTRLLEIFEAKIHAFEPWKSEVLLQRAFSELQKENPKVQRQKTRNIRSLLASLRALWLIPNKKYPPDRLPKTIDGKVLLRKEAVSKIIEEHFQRGDFFYYLKFYKNIEWAYEAFAEWYNVTPRTERLPVSWEALSADVRTSIRSLLGARHAHHKINDALALRFATREEVCSHHFFKQFFTYYITVERHRWGKSFNTIIRKILIHWDAFFSVREQLKLPVAFLPRRSGEISFQTLLAAKDRKPETILPILGINPGLWTGTARSYQIDRELHQCYESNLPLSGMKPRK